MTLALAGCGGSGYVDGTVDNRVAGTLSVGMGEATVKGDLHGAPLDTFPFNPGGECLYYRGINHSSSKGFTATGNEWEFCFQKKKLTLLLRTCAVGWRLNELDRYKSAGYHINTARYHGDASDCTH
jgi:hypothetical protein